MESVLYLDIKGDVVYLPFPKFKSHWMRHFKVGICPCN